MPRTRIISQNKAVFTSPTGLLPSNYGGSNTAVGGLPSGLAPTQLHRVDTFSFDIDIAGSRQDIREFGQLARIASVRMTDLTPTLSFGYYLGNGENEHNLGLNIRGITGTSTTGQFISGILTQDDIKKERNIYVLTVGEGLDAFDSGNFASKKTDHDVVGFGNATITSYTANFAVGEIPRADVEMECGNIIFYTGAHTGINPAVNRQTAATIDSGRFILPAPSTGDSYNGIDVLRAGDITVEFSSDNTSLGGANFSGIHIQSASIEVPIARTPIEKLGNQLAYARPLEFPINVTCSINGLVDDFKSGSLQTILTGCSFGNGIDITITAKDRCDQKQVMKWILKKALLDAQNFSVGLDDSETVDLTFSAQIGGVGTIDQGVFMSGAYTGIGVTGIDSEKPNFYSGVEAV